MGDLSYFLCLRGCLISSDRGFVLYPQFEDSSYTLLFEELSYILGLRICLNFWLHTAGGAATQPVSQASQCEN